jgi:hypothetical protein
MCASGRPDIKTVFNNLKQPIPIKRKIYLFLKNNLIKIIKLKSCCGHPGEPGC